MIKKNLFRQLLLAFSILVLAILFALKFGATENADPNLILELRLPRVLLAFAIGIGLSVSGAVLQALFSNPLCEPYTLGISSGATLGAVLGASAGLQLHVAGLAGSAFFGALVFTALLYGISLRKGTGTLVLLLSGVMLGFFGSSCVALWMALSDPNGIQNALLWLMGDLSRARLPGALFSLFLVLSLSVFIFRHARALDALLLGEEEALSLGVEVSRLRTRLVLLASLMIGVCVSGGGMIGFVGLITPHVARRAVGSLHGALLPMAALWGATALILADALSRFVVRPLELPVGVVTAFVGVPFFLWILLRKKEVEPC